MDYILTGDPAEVAKVIRENRIRVRRGVIKFTPAAPETGSDTKDITAEDTKYADPCTDDKTAAQDDSKDVQAEDTSEAKPAKKTSKRTKQSE